MNNEVFETYSIPRAVASMGIPAIVGSLVIMLYNMADTFFIGQLGDPNQVAAVAIILPVFYLFMAVGALFGVGGSSLISRSLGKKDYEMVKRTSALCFYGCIGAGLLTTLVFQLSMDNILSFFGANEETSTHARNYFTIISYGSVFMITQNMFTSIVRSEGSSRAAMAGQMIGTLINVVLDPLFVLVFGMGTTGIAIATVIGTFSATVYYLCYLKFSKTTLSVSPAYLRLDSGLLKEVFGIGLPASLMTVLSSASYLMYNKVLVGYGEIAVSASAVATRGGMLSDCFQTGMAVGVQPLVGYNYSSGNYKRMNGIIKFSFLATVLIGAVFFGGLTLFAPQFIRAFINNDEVVALGKNFLRIFILTTPISGIASTLQSVFQGMGKAKVSMLLGLGRQIFFLLVIFIGQKFGGLYGVISAQPVSVFGSLLLALCMYGAIGRELKKKSLIQKNVVEEKAIVAS